MEDLDERYMKLAIEQARYAEAIGEVPVGCVIVRDGLVIGKGYNFRETQKTALGHAEILAIQNACKAVGDWRLTGCTIYVTLEPCPMCMGAIINARLDKVVFGATDKASGCCGSFIHLGEFGFSHRPRVKGEVCVEQCTELLSDFFEKTRQQNSNNGLQ